MQRLAQLPGLACCTVLFTTQVLAQESTVEILNAARVHGTIRVQVSGQNIEYAVNADEELFPIGDGRLLLSSGAIAVRYPNFNPLRLQVTVSEERVDDPRDAQVTELLEALLQVPTIIGPAADVGGGQVLQGARRGPGRASDPEIRTGRQESAENTPQRRASADPMPTPCGHLQQASDISRDLVSNLYAAEFTASSLRTRVGRWIGLVDENPGSVGISSAVAAIEAFRANGFRERIQEAERLILGLDELSDRILVSTVSPSNLSLSMSQSYDSYVCELTARSLVSAAQLSGLRARLEEVVRLDATLEALGASLGAFVEDWHPILLGGVSVPHYRLATVEVENRKTVTVRAARINYEASETGVAASTEDVASGTFVIRAHDWFTPEVGAGLLMSGLRRPAYGTAMNEEGDTVVALAGEEDVSLKPAVTVNFVCRCGWGSLLAPMLQIGALTDTETPAVIVGGGVRLFGFGGGDFAIGFGGVVGWVRDLSDLSPGDAVDGTNSIEEDLSFQRRGSRYIALMFNF